MYVHLSSVVRYLEVRQDDEAAKIPGRAPDESLVYLERVKGAGFEPLTSSP